MSTSLPPRPQPAALPPGRLCSPPAVASSGPPLDDVVSLGQQLSDSGRMSGATAKQHLNTRELKAELEQRGVPHAHCLEKSELLELLLKHDAR